MNNIVHSSVGGFVVQQQPNVNAAYGPWETLQEAKLFLEQNFLELDENMNLAPNVPVGTTAAIYTDQTKQAIVEYWWSKGDLVQKTFGGSQYTLELIDKQGRKISSISINDGYYNTPSHIIPRMLKISTNELVDFGYIQFSIDGGSYVKYNPNSVAHREGIPTSDVTQSLVIEWRDVDNTLVTYSDVTVHNLPNIVQEFYAYNNSEEEAPVITAYNVTNSSYQGVDWTPNDYGQSDWGLIRKGVDVLNHVEWRVSRSRSNGRWSDLQGPFISGRWGFDGIVAVDKQTLYYYSTELVTDDLDEYFDVSRDWLEHYVKEDADLEDKYEDALHRIWVSTYVSPDPVNRYCYVTQRFKGMQGNQYVFGDWTTPALYSNFSVDGKDGDDIEYIYCRSTSEQIDAEALAELEKININYSSKHGLPGQEIPFDTNYAPKYWTDDPSGVTTEFPYEFCSRRYKSKDQSGICYEEFITPFVWASFGKEGPDGPGLEYIYYLTPDSTTKPKIYTNNKDDLQRSKQDDEYLPRVGETLNDPCWSDNPLSVTSAMSTLWMSQRKGKHGKWGDFTEPIVWNTFKYTYELRLTNDNCSIPASVTGDYSLEAAKKATATKVELFLGLTKINLEEEGIDISCEHYTNVGENYYLNEIIPVDIVHLAVFTARKNGQVIASKSQTVQLNKGKASYSLMCFPNSRIWYGGADYSNTDFYLKVYCLDDTGLYKELSPLELSKCYIQYQVASTSELTTINGSDLNDGFIKISHNSCDSDIYLMLYNNDGLLLDTEVIDAVDYSKIKGKDHSGITFDINDQINIPKNKADDGEYIRTKTKTHIVAHKQLKEIPIERIECTAIDLNDTVTGVITMKQTSPTDFYVDEDHITGDIMVIYSVYILIDGEEVLYELTQNINLSLDMLVYELKPKITQVMYNKYTGASVNQIPFTVISNDDNIPPYTVYYEIEGTDISGICDKSEEGGDTFFQFSDINDYLKSCDTTQTLTFTLVINDKEQDFESIDVWCEPKLDGYNYTIDLSNPNVIIPTGLDDGELQTWTSNDITVYQSGLIVSTNPGTYPYFEVKNLNNVNGVNIAKSNNNAYTTYFSKSIYAETNREQITYEIIVHENSQSVLHINRSQSISFTDDTTYSLLSNPTSIVLNPGSGGTLTYTPKVVKAHNGDLKELTNEEFSKEGLCIIVDNNDTRTSIPFSFAVNSSRTNAILVELKSSDGKILYDFDDISIVRNGAKGEDGVGVEYIYGRATSPNTIIDQNTLNNNKITAKTKETFNPGEIIDNIKWTDDPQGIDEYYQQEFISVSRYEKIDGTFTWSNFSTPKIHAQFGKKGEDGNGVEYIYTACEKLMTTSTATGFTVNNNPPITNPDGKEIKGASQIYSEDNKILDGWYDNIPDLSETHPNLYMSTRKKISGAWGPFTEPVLWNKYSTSLELILDNDQIIIDDNSDATTIEQITHTKVKAYYKGTELQNYKEYLETSISDELANSNLKVITTGTKSNEFYLTLEDGGTLSQSTSGQITYIFSYEGETITRKQTVHIKNFSAGEAYKLILTPNAIPLEVNEDGRYTWESGQTVEITILKIKGTNSQKIEDLAANDLKLYVRKQDKSETEINSIYNIPNPPSGGAEKQPSFDILLKKSGVIVDSQTLTFSTKGADGKTPIIVNLTDDSDALFVDADTTGSQSMDTNVQVFFDGTDITSSAEELTVKIDPNWTVPSGITVSVIEKSKIKVTIAQDYYSNINKDNQKLSIPVVVTVKYKGIDITQTVYYHVNIFKNFIHRELYPSINVISVKDKVYSDTSMTIKIREFKDGQASIKSILGTSEYLDYHIYESRDGQGFSEIYDENVSNLQNLNNNIKFKLTYLDTELDLETIPVVKDGINGTIGKDGVNGKNASLRMAGEWSSSKTYYFQQEINNVLYTDVVTYKSNDKLQFYSAKKTGTNKTPSANSEYWDPVAHSDVTLTQQLLIYNDESGSISGGFVDTENQQGTEGKTADGIILWAGGSGTDELTSAQSATFSVTRGGVIKAKEGLFEGCYMPSIRTITQPKISNYINYQYASWNSDGTTTAYCNLHINEISEGMKFNIPKITFTWNFNNQYTKVGTINNISNLSYNSGSNTYTVNYAASNVILMDNINIDLPRGVYIASGGDDHEAEWTTYNFIINSFSYDLSQVFQDDLDGYDPNYPSQIPAIKYVSDLINEDTSSFTYFKIPFISYLLDKASTSFSGTANTHPLLSLIGTQNYKKLLHQYLRWQLETAIPFIGKTVTIYNKPSQFQVSGILPESLQNLTTLVDTNNNLINLCKYLSRDDAYLDNSTNTDFIQVKCVTKPLICGPGGKKYGYYICWERLSEAEGNFNVEGEHTPIENKDDLNTFISFK